MSARCRIDQTFSSELAPWPRWPAEPRGGLVLSLRYRESMKRVGRSCGLRHQFVLTKRIERAQAPLGNPSLSRAENALRAGFADQPHFSRMFHRQMGLAPREYRQALR